MPLSAPLLILVLSAFHALTGQGGAHPQDGPDVDLRIRITDRNVQLLVQLNLSFVDALVSVPREFEEYVEPAELEAIREALFDHFRGLALVTIDGREPVPELDGFVLEEGDPEVAINFPKEGLKALTKVRWSIDYPVEEPPNRAVFRWFDYPADTAIAFPWMKEVPPLDVVAEIAAGAKTELVTFSTQEPEHTWHRPREGLAPVLLKVPRPAAPIQPLRLPILALAIGCALVAALGWSAWTWRRSPRARGIVAITSLLLLLPSALLTRDVWVVELADPFAEDSALPTRDEARAVFEPLHANIYKAFDYRRESAIYDALERSVAGPLLGQLYLSVYRSLILEEAGNAVARVEEVTLLESPVERIGELGSPARPAFVTRCRWRVHGSVFHFRHTHERTSEYLARYTVSLTDEGWRITGHEPIEQRRLDAPDDRTNNDGR